MEEKFLIEEAFENIDFKGLKSIFFINDDGTKTEDLNFSESYLPIRVVDSLKFNGITKISETIFLHCDSVKHFKNMGFLSYNLLLKYISSHVVCSFEGEISESLVELHNRTIRNFLNKGIDEAFNNAPKQNNKNKFESSKVSKLIIQKLFPEKEFEDIEQFKSIVGFKFRGNKALDDLNLDTSILEQYLSRRAFNSLNKYAKSVNFKTLKDVLFSDCLLFECTHGMGEKSRNEIYSLFIENTVFNMDEINNKILKENNYKNEKLDKIINKISEVLYDGNIDFPYQNLLNDIRLKIVKLDDEFINEDNIGRVLEVSFKFLSDYVQNLIFENSQDEINMYLNRNDLVILLPNFFVKYDLLDKILNFLIDKKEILLLDGTYQKWRISLNEWLDTLDSKKKNIISLRFSGETLEQIGENFSLTRERIRQIISMSTKHMPELIEDRYKYWFEKYFLNSDDFCNIFECSLQEYQYLDYKYKKGMLDIFEMENDVYMTSSIYKKLKKQILKYCLLINGKYVVKKKSSILSALIEIECKKKIKMDDFYCIYNNFIKENNLENDEDFLFSNLRAFTARVEDNKCVLSSYGRKFRYYPFDNYDFEELANRLELEKYNNLEISTLLLFRENRELMEEYNILDEYELHNLLKKTQTLWDDNNVEINFMRMPFISVGNSDREKQIRDFLVQIAPVTLEEFGQFCEMEFGVLSQTAMANYFDFVREFYHKGLFETNQILFTDEEHALLQNELVEDFYTIQEIKNKFISLCDHADLRKLNARNYHRLGFKPYSGYVIKNTFDSSQEYFTHLFTENNILDLNKINSKILLFSAASSVLYNLRNDFKLIEIEDKVYMREDYFFDVIGQNELSIRDLESFMDDFMDFAKDYEYFTLKKIVDDGFHSDLLNLGLPLYFYSSLLKNTYKYKYQKVGNNILFYQNKDCENKTSIDFFEHILRDKKSMNIYDFINFIEENYDVKYSKDKIVYWLGKSELFYDSTMEKIYINKDEYYNDIF